MNETAPSLQHRLVEITEAYVAGLPERLHVLEETAARLLDAPPEDESRAAVSEIRDIAHRLAGSGATYGFHALSMAARELEAACDRSIEGDGAGDPASLMGYVDIVHQRIAEAMSTPLKTADLAEAGFGKAHGTVADSGVVVFLASPSADADWLAQELSLYGFEVQRVPSLPESGMAGENERPSVLLVDAVFEDDTLPDASALRAYCEAFSPAVPLVLTSGRDDLCARLAGVRAGADAFLVKPVDPNDLVDAIENVASEDESEPCRILVIDDDPTTALYTATVLTDAGMIVRTLNDVSDVLDVLDAFAPELLLVDLYMPVCTGQELAAVIRQQQRFAATPIVYLSSERDITRQQSAMEEGGDDFLTKPIQPEHLVLAVRSRVRRFRALRSRMVRDSLTNLYNHTTTKQFLENEIQRAKRAGACVSFAIVDMDNFKSVNDRYGHLVGDEVIRSLSRLLRQRLRANDIVGRLGGEEFGVILPDTPASQATAVMEELRRTFVDILHRADEETFSVTISCGVAAYPAYDTMGALIDAADQALYRAKREGRNRVELSGA